ncbi:MAG TPA: AraC family transcriptional regulator [Steroidobacter sp.]
MTETLFAFDERNYQDCQRSFRGARNEEYYVGDYSIEAGSIIDVRADKKGIGAYSIIRLRSRTRLFFRRSWAHIREDATDVTVLWFVKRGQLSVSHQTGQSIAKPGDFFVTRSMTPFCMECQTDEDSVHEVLHVIIPTHLLRRFTLNDVHTGFTMPAVGREFAIAERLLMDLFEDGANITEQTAGLLMESALAVLNDAIKQKGSVAPQRQTLTERRLQDVQRFIEIHLSDPKLSISSVAKGCGISPRYLSFLLKQHGTPFSTLIWDKRLSMASRWLLSSKPLEASISEIAYRVGFKSPAHFSRMFKRVFLKCPSEYRAAGADAATPHHELFANSANLLQ